jgi:hypothetical protein
MTSEKFQGITIQEIQRLRTELLFKQEFAIETFTTADLLDLTELNALLAKRKAAKVDKKMSFK